MFTLRQTRDRSKGHTYLARTSLDALIPQLNCLVTFSSIKERELYAAAPGQDSCHSRLECKDRLGVGINDCIIPTVIVFLRLCLRFRPAWCC